MGRVRRRGNDDVGPFGYTDLRRSEQMERIVERELDEAGRVRRERLGVRTRTIYQPPNQLLSSGESAGWLRWVWRRFVEILATALGLVAFLGAIALGYEIDGLRGMGIVILGTALVITIAANYD